MLSSKFFRVTHSTRRSDHGAHATAATIDRGRAGKEFSLEREVRRPDVESAPASFLYSDTDGCHFMEEKSYEQFAFPNEEIGNDRNYLKEGVSLQVLKYNGAPVSLQLPQYVELAVVATELGLRGDTAAGGPPKWQRWKLAWRRVCRFSSKKER